jgi:tRNA (guanine10-N2)-dimethyltransferase
MRLLFELSGEHETLPRSEVLAAIEAEGHGYEVMEEEDRILVLETDADPERLGNRVALVHAISEHIASGSISELEEGAEGMDIDGTVAIRMRDLKPKLERTADRAILERIGGILTKGRKVDLENPEIEIRLIQRESNYLGIQRTLIDRPSFQQRKVDNRPFFSPISLHPKFARALVNLARASEGEIFLDPFCGTGGILLEAGFIGADLVGSDIKDEMIEGCKENLAKYDVHSSLYKSDVGDIGTQVEEVASIATDPPYGRSSSTMKEDPASLYKRSFRAFQEVLKKEGYLGIVLPKEKYVEMGEEFLELHEMHKQRVHKSLDRFYCVFRNH